MMNKLILLVMMFVIFTSGHYDFNELTYKEEFKITLDFNIDKLNSRQMYRKRRKHYVD